MQDSHPRVWIDPDSLFDRIVVLVDGALIVANPSGDGEPEAAKQKIEAGQPVLEALGSKAKTIRFDKIKKLSSNKHSDMVDYQHDSDGKLEADNISMASQEARDQLFEALRGKLDSTHTYDCREFSRARGAFAPIIWIAIVVGATALLSGAASEIAEGKTPDIEGRRALLKRLLAWVLEFLGSTGVLIVGGIITVACIFWLIKRIQLPPIMMTFKRKA